MKKFGTLVLLLSLFALTVGCSPGGDSGDGGGDTGGDTGGDNTTAMVVHPSTMG